MHRRTFLSVLSSTLLTAARRLPANKNVKWALSANLWTHFPPVAFTDILDVMKDTGFLGIRMTQFPGILENYGLTLRQLEAELSRRDLRIATISFSGPADVPEQQASIQNEARKPVSYTHLGMVALAATLVPARSATRIEPMLALRSE